MPHATCIRHNEKRISHFFLEYSTFTIAAAADFHAAVATICCKLVALPIIDSFRVNYCAICRVTSTQIIRSHA